MEMLKFITNIALFLAIVSIMLFLFIYALNVLIVRPLIFPGSTYLANFLNWSKLEKQRKRILLFEEHAYRNTLKSSDGTEIDSVYIDKRDSTENGSYLVITSAGNADFYEQGYFRIPSKLGYSVMGWNYPGYGFSSGKPSKSSLENAAEVVYEYAINVLNFPPCRIILYGYSMGGFPTCHLAGKHKDVGGVIIDATFGNLVTLVKNKMPCCLASLAGAICSVYFDFDNEKNLLKYPGPVRIIRRTKDEVMTTDVDDPLTNHGNELLTSLLSARYPEIFDDDVVKENLKKWLRYTDSYSREACLPEDVRSEYKASRNGTQLDKTKKLVMAYYIFNKYLTDFYSGHGGFLDAELFGQPC